MCTLSEIKEKWMFYADLFLSLTAKVIYDLDFLNKDCSKSSEVKNFWEF